MKSGVFVSDLHHFASRSQRSRYETQIISAAQSADLLVLGGDIFDFRWSTLGSVAASIQAASDWLEQLLAEAQNCEVVYVLGNHDYHEDFISRVGELAGASPRLSFERFIFRVGDSVFLHGDVSDGYVTEAALREYRSNWQCEQTRKPWESRIYDIATKMRVHVPVVIGAHRRRQTARRIASYLGEVGHDATSGVRRVFYGHTHRAVNGYVLDGLEFFNGGAPLNGLAFRMIEFDMHPLSASDHGIGH